MWKVATYGDMTTWRQLELVTHHVVESSKQQASVTEIASMNHVVTQQNLPSVGDGSAWLVETQRRHDKKMMDNGTKSTNPPALPRHRSSVATIRLVHATFELTSAFNLTKRCFG